MTIQTSPDLKKGKVPELAILDNDTLEAPKMHRKLQARHLEMIAIGGTIGTGLFIASGNAIKDAGPLGALIAYGIIGLQVFGLVTGLGEMATLFPVPGAFSKFGTRFINDAYGFCNGWVSFHFVSTILIIFGTFTKKKPCSLHPAVLSLSLSIELLV
jgi:amino acid permease